MARDETRPAPAPLPPLPSPNDPRIRDACERVGVGMLVLFGSQVPGGLAPEAGSDVDLAFLSRRDGERRSAAGGRWLSGITWDLYDALAPLFGHRSLDMVDLTRADPLFRWEIMERAVLLHGDIDQFFELRAYAYRDYVDSADLRALEQALFREEARPPGTAPPCCVLNSSAASLAGPQTSSPSGMSRSSSRLHAVRSASTRASETPQP